MIAVGALLLSSATRAAAEAAAAGPGPDHGKMATEEATPVGLRAVEVEAAYSPSLTRRGSGTFDRAAPGEAHAFSLAVFYGLTEHLDVKVAGGYGHLTERPDHTPSLHGTGASDLVVGTRWRFLADVERALDLTLASTVVAPVGAEERPDRLGLTQGYWTLRNALVASKDWGRSTANAELALTLPVSGGAGTFEGGVSANVAVGHAIVSWLQPIAELNYDAVRDGTSQQRLALTAGVNLTSAAGTRLLLGVQQAVWGRNVPQDVVALAAAKVAF